MTKMAAVFSLSGYLNRFPNVDEMVSLSKLSMNVRNLGSRNIVPLSPYHLIKRLQQIRSISSHYSGAAKTSKRYLHIRRHNTSLPGLK